MSRKTKKEKIRTKSRRLQETLPQMSEDNPVKNFAPTYSFTPSSEKTAEIKNHSQIAPSAKSQFSDLRRILVLTIIAICAQGVLWYLVEKGTIKLF